MNDDELKKLFGDSAEEDSKDAKPSKEGDVSEPSLDTKDTKKNNETHKEKKSKEEPKKSEDEKAKEEKPEKDSKEAELKEAELKEAELKAKEEAERKEEERKKAIEEEKRQIHKALMEQKEKARKEELKKQARLERIRKIEEFENNAELKRQERKRRNEELGPLYQRQFLSDFPLTYKGLLIALLVIVSLILVWCIGFHPYFRVNRITVVGNHELTDEEILSDLNLEYGSHMFRNYYSDGKALVENNPYIQDISIKRKFPSSIEIQVKERKKIAYISTPDGYIAIDDQGIVLELSSDKNVEVSPLLCGIDINSATIGKKVDVLQDNSFRKMIIVLSAALSASESYDGIYSGVMDYDFFSNIKEIRIISSGTLFISIKLPSGSDLQVKINDMNTITDDMQWLIYAIENSAFDGLPNGVLDMTGDEYIYREYGY